MTDTQQPRRRGRPPTGETPKHYFRAPQALWDDVTTTALANKESATALVIRAIERELQRLKVN
jgi:hypothetical protein